MKHQIQGLFALSLFLLTGASLQAQTIFTIGDSNATVNAPAGVVSGDEIRFQGQIITDNEDGVYLTGFPTDLMVTFTSDSIVRVIDTGGSSSEGVLINDDFNGVFTNDGIIESHGGEAVQFNDDFSGTFTNAGRITSTSEEAIHFEGEFTGDFLNTGMITSLTSDGEEGVEVDDDFTGTFTNRGTISAIDDEGIYMESKFTGTFQNSGTIFSGDNEAVIIYEEFSGSFLNSGSISGYDEGIEFYEVFDGTFVNSGTISSEDDAAILIGSDFTGSFLNSGTISGSEEGVTIESDFEGSFTNTGMITSINNEAVYVDDDFTGSFLNSGTISGFTDGVEVDDDFEGTFTNSGTILSTDGDGIELGGEFMSGNTFTNTGTIQGAASGINLLDTTGGTWLNSGIIKGQSGFGIDSQFGTANSADFTNHGGRISGPMGALHFGAGNATLNIESASHIQGLMNGGAGNGDTIRFQNIRGISDAKRAELQALAGADPTKVTSITLFGETMSFTGFESIQVDLASLQSYEAILRPGLGNYGAALDNVIQLNDEIREFLNSLNDVDLAELNRITGTTSGQVIVSGLDDFVQHQDANLFSLFSNEFSTLRGDRSGSASLAANGGNGLFTREIQVGVTVQEPLDTAHVFVTGFVGEGSQDPNSVRSGSSIDNTSIIFGRTDHVSDEWMLGLWGGYVENESNVDSFGSLLENEAGYIGLNASYLSGDLFSNFILGYGFHEQSSTRRDFRGGVHDGDTAGNQALLQAQVGRDLYFGTETRAKVSPYLGFAVSALSMEGFTENGPALTRLRFSSETTISAQSVVGVNISTFEETNHGWIKPKFDAAWWHEFAEADDYGVSLATPGFLNTFQVGSPVANRNRGVIQAGLEFGLDRWEGVSFEATYFGAFGGDGYSSHGGAFSASFEF